MLNAKYVLMDIEGTTTPITFVHDVLFPYSSAHLAAYVRTHAADAAVRQSLEGTKATVASESKQVIDDEGAILQLLTWIKEDRKHAALKMLQGLIWRTGYEDGAYKALVYDDVPVQLRAWKAAGHTLGIYSSGSVEAQKLLFLHTQHGNLLPLLSHHFDTAVGGKREAQAYRTILASLGREPSDVVFLSDIVEELDAAKTAGLAVCQIVRPGTKPAGRHAEAATFKDVRI